MWDVGLASSLDPSVTLTTTAGLTAVIDLGADPVVVRRVWQTIGGRRETIS